MNDSECLIVNVDDNDTMQIADGKDGRPYYELNSALLMYLTGGEEVTSERVKTLRSKKGRKEYEANNYSFN
jgi:hypothetical protein